MQWYIAKIVFRIICGEGNHTPQFDEQLRLVMAENEQDAFIKASDLGVSTEESFHNHRHELVQWKFLSIPELYRLENLGDGDEIYSRIHEEENASRYVDTVQKKAE